ncbi:hypothetical protein Cgig2_020456 [Carnegiea gigantea]|uniref:Chromatin modification-related protein MEAF6 n=1 Tax=Carnegiea gigantea TaxID=171969 RepID=A0A9Q1JXT9_9CARY|nr:hypothetical protein Cgig2_020456 [Carnegiea gigantea]
MEPNGQEASNPGAKLASLLSKREKLQDELRNIEKQVYELETTYLQDSNQFGHVSKGFEGFLSSSKSTTKKGQSSRATPPPAGGGMVGSDQLVLAGLCKGIHLMILNSAHSGLSLKRPRKFQPEDRIFSLSSVTSPAVEEHTGGRDDPGPGRSKGGGMAASGQGKPKKGRIAP